MTYSTKRLTYLAVLAALSLVLELVIHFPIIPAVPFLLYAAGDLPMLFASIILGPLEAIVITASTSVLFALITGEGGPWGMLMHFIASGTFVLVFYLVFRGTLFSKERKASMVNLLLALLLATVARAAIMVPANILITPIYMKVPVEAVKGLLLPAIVPFNLIYGGINTAIFFGLYASLKNHLPKLNQEKFFRNAK